MDHVQFVNALTKLGFIIGSTETIFAKRKYNFICYKYNLAMTYVSHFRDITYKLSYADQQVDDSNYIIAFLEDNDYLRKQMLDTIISEIRKVKIGNILDDMK